MTFRYTNAKKAVAQSHLAKSNLFALSPWDIPTTRASAPPLKPIRELLPCNTEKAGNNPLPFEIYINT